MLLKNVKGYGMDVASNIPLYPSGTRLSQGSLMRGPKGSVPIRSLQTLKDTCSIPVQIIMVIPVNTNKEANE